MFSKRLVLLVSRALRTSYARQKIALKYFKLLGSIEYEKYQNYTTTNILAKFTEKNGHLELSLLYTQAEISQKIIESKEEQ